MPAPHNAAERRGCCIHPTTGLEQDERAYDEGPVSKSFHALEAEMKDFVHSILPCGEQVCNKNKNACFCTCCHPFPPSTQMLKAD